MSLGAWVIDEAGLRKFFKVAMSDFHKDFLKAISAMHSPRDLGKGHELVARKVIHYTARKQNHSISRAWRILIDLLERQEQWHKLSHYSNKSYGCRSSSRTGNKVQMQPSVALNPVYGAFRRHPFAALSAGPCVLALPHWKVNTQP
jgi:hypothetical protein